MLGVVIVNYRTPELVIKCVDSLLAHGVCAPQNIVVVENCSGDKSLEVLVERLPSGIRVEAASSNRGFGAGVNIGVKKLDTEFVLVLNPDTYFLENSVSRVTEAMCHDASIGLVGLDLVYPGGERQYSARRYYSIFDIVLRRTSLKSASIFRNRMKRHLMVSELEAGVPFDADWVMGTGFVVRKNIFDQLGGMDEEYFLYMEDVDLCSRVWAFGKRVIAFPNAVLVHDHQRASSTGVFGWAARQHMRSLFIFMSKYRVPFFSSPSERVISK